VLKEQLKYRSREEVLDSVKVEIDLSTYAGRLAARQLAYASFALGNKEQCDDILAVVGREG